MRRDGRDRDGSRTPAASGASAPPGSAAEDESPESRSQLSGLPRSSSSAPRSGAATVEGACRRALGEGREPSRSSIASRAASCARGGLTRARTARRRWGAWLNSQSLSFAGSSKSSKSAPAAGAAADEVLGRLGRRRRLGIQGVLRRAIGGSERGRTPRRLDEEGMLAAGAAHTRTARRNLGVVEMKLRRALFAGDDQRSPPAAPARTPVLGSRRHSPVLTFRSRRRSA